MTRSAPNTLTSRLLVAGGGGGGGGVVFISPRSAPGTGGDAGSAGADGRGCCPTNIPGEVVHTDGGTGGGAGGSAVGGAAGTPGGQAGSQGLGGTGDTGGGGGGGLYGGGSGGNSADIYTTVHHTSGGGGGGGGSNLVPPGGTSGLTTDPPQITISYALTKEQCKNGGWQSYGVFKNQGDCVSFVATGGKNQPALSS